MNISPHSQNFAADAPLDAAPIDLPCVSIIIVNYNYGRFLGRTVDSVFAQTYTNVECIVVDNASTDESDDVLHEIALRYPQVRVIRRASNDGQTPASLDGFAASRGAYVIFVDADDLLLPTCVSTHVYVHLSLRSHVGFTSGDMLQVADDQVVVSTGSELNRYIRSGRGIRSTLMRPYHHPYGTWPAADVAKTLDGKVHFVPPLSNAWVWSPTSGNCFRRDALKLFADHPPLATLRTGTDMYFAHGINALSGSALIDEPVFAYRIHGGNIFTQHAQLNRVLCFQPGCPGDNNDKARLMIIDHLVANAARFTPNLPLRIHFAAVLKRLDHRDPDATKPGWARRSRLAAQLVEHYASVSAALGPALTLLLMLISGVPPRLIWTKSRGSRPGEASI